MQDILQQIKDVIDSAFSVIRDLIQSIQQEIRHSIILDYIRQLQRKRDQLQASMDVSELNKGIVVLRDIAKKGEISDDDMKMAKDIKVTLIGY